MVYFFEYTNLQFAPQEVHFQPLQDYHLIQKRNSFYEEPQSVDWSRFQELAHQNWRYH